MFCSSHNPHRVINLLARQLPRNFTPPWFDLSPRLIAVQEGLPNALEWFCVVYWHGILYEVIYNSNNELHSRSYHFHPPILRDHCGLRNSTQLLPFPYKPIRQLHAPYLSAPARSVDPSTVLEPHLCSSSLISFWNTTNTNNDSWVVMSGAR